MKTLTILISFFSFTNVMAKYTHYYSDRTREIAISSTSETLLMFPKVPLASSCQPAHLLDIQVPEDPLAVLNDHLSSIENLSRADKETKPEDTMTFLKVIPSRREGVVVCSFSLSGKETFSVKFSLKNDVNRPLIEFKNSKKNKELSKEIRRNLPGMEIFKAFLNSKDIPSFDEEEVFMLERSYRTEQASYDIKKILTDGLNYKLVLIEGKARTAFEPIKLNVKNAGLFLYTSFIPLGKKSLKLHKNDTFSLYIMVTDDFQPSDLKEVLP